MVNHQDDDRVPRRLHGNHDFAGDRRRGFSYDVHEAPVASRLFEFMLYVLLDTKYMQVMSEKAPFPAHQ